MPATSTSSRALAVSTRGRLVRGIRSCGRPRARRNKRSRIRASADVPGLNQSYRLEAADEIAGFRACAQIDEELVPLRRLEATDRSRLRGIREARSGLRRRAEGSVGEIERIVCWRLRLVLYTAPGKECARRYRYYCAFSTSHTSEDEGGGRA